MPGRRARWGSGDEKKDVVILRIHPETKKRWTEYVEKRGGYLSGLVRRAVDEYLTRHPNPNRVDFFA